MIFSKAKAKTHKYKFTHEDTELEIVDNYKYLGLTLAHNGSFKLAITSLCTQASRAMYSLIGKSRRLDLPIDLQLELFDNLVLPIMLYQYMAVRSGAVGDMTTWRFCTVNI